MTLPEFDPLAAWRLTLALLHVTWLGAALAAVVAIGNWLLRKSSAAARYRWNFAALCILGLCLPATYAAVRVTTQSPVNVWETVADATPSTVPLESAPNGAPGAMDNRQPPAVMNAAVVETSPNTVITNSQPVGDRLRAMSPYVAALYLLGVLVMLAKLVLAVRGGKRLRAARSPIADVLLLECAARQARRLALRLTPAVAWCDRVATPVVVGIVRPMILLPPAIVAGLTPDQLAAVLTHELAHLRRNDHLAIVAQRLLEAVLFFHPAAWLLSRRIHQERERACDDLVVAAGADRVQYAASLLRVAELRLSGAARKNAAALAADGASPSRLRQRIARLLGAEDEPAVRLLPSGLAAVSLAAICVAGACLAMCLTPQDSIHAADAAGQLAEAKKELAAGGQDDAKREEKAPEPAGKAAPLKEGVLVAATVIDAETGKPVAAFRVIPGTPFMLVKGPDDPSPAVWQPHMLREATGGQFEWLAEHSYAQFRLRFEAEGYIPAYSLWIAKSDGPQSIEVKLRRDPGIAGRVLKPDGQPAAGAVLAVTMPNRGVRLDNGKFADADDPPPAKPGDRWRRPIFVRADDQGRYRLPTEPGAVMTYAIHETGIAEVSNDALAASTDIQLAAWGAIDGRVLWEDKPGKDEKLHLSMMREAGGYPEVCSLFMPLTSDGEGRFQVGKLPPWQVQISRSFDLGENRGYLFPHLHLTVAAGPPTEVVLGGAGRPVIGKLAGLDSYAGITVSIAPNMPRPGDESGMQGHFLVRESNLGPIFFREKLPVKEDGTFRIEHVVPEYYQLFIRNDDNSVFQVHQLRVEASPPGQPDQPQDAGEIKIRPRS